MDGESVWLDLPSDAWTPLQLAIAGGILFCTQTLSILAVSHTAIFAASELGIVGALLWLCCLASASGPKLRIGIERGSFHYCELRIPTAELLPFEARGSTLFVRTSHERFRIAAGADAASVADRLNAALHRASVPPTRPTNLHMLEHRDSGRFVFTTSPSRIAAVPVGIAAAVWNGVTLAGIHGAGVMVFVPFLVVGVVLLLVALVLALNDQRVTLDVNALRSTATPLRDLGDVAEPLPNIECFVEARGAARSFRPAGEWTVQMLTRDGRAVPLNVRLPQQSHARYVAARLNRALEQLRTPTTYRG